jgi:hypothetical protein
MSWEWPKTDRGGLARFVSGDVAPAFDLKINRNDLSPDADGRRKLVNAIYFALQNKELRYALEKYYPDDAVQLIRSPSEILGQKEGTCLDLALLFCGVCLGYELLPQVVLIEGHALATVALNFDLRNKDAFNRTERNFFENALLTNADVFRQMVKGGSYIAVECTGFAQTEKLPAANPEGVGRDFQKLLPFERALNAGSEQLNNVERPFLFALDIAWAHDLGFRPTKETNLGATSARAKTVVGQGIEVSDAKIREVVGVKGDAPIDSDTDVLTGAKLKGVEIDSIIGIDNSGQKK